MTLPEAVPASCFHWMLLQCMSTEGETQHWRAPRAAGPPSNAAFCVVAIRCGIPKALQLLIRLGLFTVAARATGS